jgi:Protein of unknown function (DUF1091)
LLIPQSIWKIGFDIVEKFQVKSDILDGGKKLVFPIPKFNYCQVKDVSDKIPFLHSIIAELSRFGTIVQSCPLQTGHYYLKEGFIDESAIELDRVLTSGQQYTLRIEVTDEYNKRKSMNLFKLFLTASYIK